MIQVPVVQDGEAQRPAEDLAQFTTVVRWVCNGQEYVGYEDGDPGAVLPQDPEQA